MKKENRDRILLPFSRHHHSLNRILAINALQPDRVIDLLYVAGIDPEEADPSELAAIVEAVPEVDRCYRCDARGLMEDLEGPPDPELLLADLQLRYILRTLVLAHFIRMQGYEKVFYYSVHIDHRLNEIPVSLVLKDAEFHCLMKETEDASPAAKAAERFFRSQVLSLNDQRPAYGYTMKEKDIRKLCRKILRSHVLETLKLEEVCHK